MDGTATPLEVISRSAAQTHALGRQIGEALTTGLILTLKGDLGCGKTTFVQGLAEGLHVPASYYITSPTYTIINSYPARIPFHHIDLYRLGDPEELEDIGFYELLQPEAVVAIEWPALTAGNLPLDHLAIAFEILNDDARKIQLHAYGLRGRTVIERLDRSERKGTENGPIP